MEAFAPGSVAIRPLRREDLDRVVAIDAAVKGVTRRVYFERRLRCALADPQLHAQFAAADGKGLAGYVLARALTGEFGRTEPAFRLEVVGVRDDARGHGVGASLFEALCDYGRRHGIAEVRTIAMWNDHAMLHWLDAMGFRLGPEHVVDCAVAGGEYAPERDLVAAARERDEPPAEINYGDEKGNDFEQLARDRIEVRSMEPGDLDDIVRIDRSIMRRDRRDYVQRKLLETISDSAISVSLTARMEGAIVGFVTARVDLGDFGRTESVAVLDTIGVDASCAHRGVGHALLSQLFVNLGALRIERVETVVGPRELALLDFLHAVGFASSQRLPFVRRIA